MLFVIARTLSFQKWATYQANLPTILLHIISSVETGGCFWHQRNTLIHGSQLLDACVVAGN